MPQVKKPLIKRLIEKAIKEADIKVGSEGTMFTISVEVSNPQSETKLGIHLDIMIPCASGPCAPPDTKPETLAPCCK